MAKISTIIHGVEYTFSCGEGQEEHLLRLCTHMDARVKELSATLGAVNENELLVFTGLMLCDELSDSYAEIDKLKNDIQMLKDQQPQIQENVERSVFLPSGNEATRLKESLQNIAERLETLVDKYI